MRVFWIVGCAFTVGCASYHPRGPVDLTPQGTSVEILVEAPSVDGHSLVANIRAEATGNDLDAATSFAKNDLRNQAAALGATLVTVDDTKAEPVPLQNTVTVRLVGRAYKPVD
ncbi:MAG: hypothetical protein ABTD50_00810 [Polyangiaceae bacterium]